MFDVVLERTNYYHSKRTGLARPYTHKPVVQRSYRNMFKPCEIEEATDRVLNGEDIADVCESYGGKLKRFRSLVLDCLLERFKKN